MKLLFCLALITAFLNISCGAECDIPMESTNIPEQPSKATYFDSIDVRLEGIWPTERTPWTAFVITLAKLGGEVDPSDSITLNGEKAKIINGKLQASLLEPEPEAGSYRFVFHHLQDSAIVELPKPPFNITKPTQNSTVTFWNNTNTEITFTPANGVGVWAYYYGENLHQSILDQKDHPDDGHYFMEPGGNDVGGGRGYVHLIRTYRDSLDHPKLGKLWYNYYTRSNKVDVKWGG